MRIILPVFIAGLVLLFGGCPGAPDSKDAGESLVPERRGPALENCNLDYGAGCTANNGTFCCLPKTRWNADSCPAGATGCVECTVGFCAKIPPREGLYDRCDLDCNKTDDCKDAWAICGEVPKGCSPGTGKFKGKCIRPRCYSSWDCRRLGEKYECDKGECRPPR